MSESRGVGYVLAACPFCGMSDVEIARTEIEDDFSDAFYEVSCGRCDIEGPGGFTPDEAAARWNRRGKLTPNIPPEWPGDVRDPAAGCWEMVKSHINSSTGDPCYCRRPCVPGKRYCDEHKRNRAWQFICGRWFYTGGRKCE